MLSSLITATTITATFRTSLRTTAAVCLLSFRTMSDTAALQVDPKRQEEIRLNLADIQARVNASLEAARQRPALAALKTRLVAVSKTKPASDIAAAYALGHRHFGENYIQELVEKAAILPKDIKWHFIGSLQSNKCKLLSSVANLAVVETIDSVKKGVAMNKEWKDRPSPLEIYIQVNTSGEDSKSGVSPAECVQVAREIASTCPNIKIAGLMTIGAPHNVSDGKNPDFETLARCRTDTEAALGLAGGSLELSMGMSDDFETAIAHGSTNVRVGSSIFGARSYPPKA
ncbi:hypothetical protein BC831DRAFT_459347 [Entophlyctis helioformis]|nr:hypothetical protein BC831DRAFT_459347 [Entophlyctis helioformis]